jgi:hypothetical protein
MEVHAWCNGALDPATVVFFRLVDLSEAYMLVVCFSRVSRNRLLLQLMYNGRGG